MIADALRRPLTTVLFFRDEHFYFVELLDEADLPKGMDRAADIANHVRLNPGTIRVETVDGKVLWPEGARSSRDTVQ